MRSPQLPDYGCLARWPEDGVDFAFPADLSQIQQLFPSQRVFRRESFDGSYYQCRYGDIHFRLRPCLWQPIRYEGIDIGDEVETTGVGMARELCVAVIEEMFFSPRERLIVYQLSRAGMTLPNVFLQSQLRLIKSKDRI